MQTTQQSAPPPPITLTCLVEWDQETSLFVGHCLNFDLVSTSRIGEDEAFANLRTLIKRHIEYSYTHHRAGLSVSADESDWTRLQNLIESGMVVQRGLEQIQVNFNEPWNSPKFFADVKLKSEANETSTTAVPASC